MTAKMIFADMGRVLMTLITPSPEALAGRYLAPRRGARGIWGRRSKYSGDELREIRRRNGVGRPPRVNLARRKA